MDILKKHKGKVFASILIAIMGVGAGVLPYFSVAAIINNIVERNIDINNYLPYMAIMPAGFLGSILFHELSTVISHNLAYGIIEDKRKLLAGKLSSISMGEVEKKAAANGCSSW